MHSTSHASLTFICARPYLSTLRASWVAQVTGHQMSSVSGRTARVAHRHQARPSQRNAVGICMKRENNS